MKNNSKVIEKTLHYWNNVKGSNCARSTACGLLSVYGKKDLIDPLYAAMLPMGGGIVGERSICGAVIGTISSLGILLPEKFAEEKEPDKLVTENIKEWNELFKKEFGTLLCRFLLDDFKDNEGNIDMKDPNRRKRCTEIVKESVALAQKIIDR